MRRGASEQFSKGIEQLRVAQRHVCLARSTQWQHYCCPLSYAAQLSFSASEAHSNQPSSPMSPQPSRGPSGPPGKHPHKSTSKPTALPLGKIGVAIVDDDENFQVFLRDIIDHTRQFRCVGSYTSGEAALIGIPHSGAQIVLMDIKMPGMSGIECARRLKALLPHLIIVMITGLDDPRQLTWRGRAARGDSCRSRLRPPISWPRCRSASRVRRPRLRNLSQAERVQGIAAGRLRLAKTG